jgi:hypothetical protein
VPAGRCSAPTGTFAPALKPKKDEASVVVTAVYSLYIRTMSTPQGTHGGMATFNIQHGFVEALVRGMRSSFLGDADYHHLTQCETLEDVKLNLSETDYGSAVADLGTLNPSDLQAAAITKVRDT